MNPLSIINLEKPIFSISELAQQLNIHPRTLIIYDELGLLSPHRTNKNRRKYSFLDLQQAQLIMFLTRNLAINLAGVKILLNLFNKNKINFEEIKKIAFESGINEKIQQENITKIAKRGRPKSLND